MVEEKAYWQRKMARRRTLQGFALIGAGLAAAGVIGGGNEPSRVTTTTESQPAEAQPKRGGTMTRSRGEALDAYAAGFDPYVVTGAYPPLMGLFYQNLISYHPKTLELQPELAQKWEQRSQAEITFTLAPGVKWHNKPPANGRELTAADVVSSLERARTDDPRFINRSLLGSVDRIEAVDRSTVRITTKTPDVTLLSNLSDVTMLILNPEVVERAGRFTTAETAVGTGAFVLESSDDTSSRLVRNPNYWKQGFPYMDGVRLAAINDPQARWSALLAGQLDMTIAPGQEAKKFASAQQSGYMADWAEDVSVQSIYQNTRKKPFDDARVNRALRLLVDHQEAVTGWAEVFFGRGTFLGSAHLPAALATWDFPEEEYRQARTPQFLEWKNPKDDAARKALSLLNAAGFNRDNPLRFTLIGVNLSGQQQASELLQAQFHRLGQGAVQVELQVFDNNTHLGFMSRGEFDMAGPAARGGTIEPDQALRTIFHSSGSQNFGKWSDRNVDQLIDRQRGTFDATQRKAVIKEIIAYLHQNAPHTGFSSLAYLNVTQSKVKNFLPEHRSRFRGDQYERIWLDV